MKLEGCRFDLKLSARHHELEAEVKANGGCMTAVEFAHSAAFERAGMCWTRRAAEASIKRQQQYKRWLGAHAHDDGSVWIPRLPK